MRRVQPITRTFRNQLRDFGAIPIPRNWLFRRVLYLLRRAHCLLTCLGDTIDKTTNVPVTLTTIRVVDTLAKKTFVFNNGAQSATIFENGVIIGVVAPGQRYELPIAGRLKLQAQTDAGTTALRVLTFRRCLCGDALPPYDAGIVTPTGIDLI